MLVFVTNPKYFDEEKIKNKTPDLIYIFNSRNLYQILSKTYKCVNLDKSGVIKNENFFPLAKKYKPVTKEKFLDIKLDIYKYFKRRLFLFQKEHYQMVNSWYDNKYKIVKMFAKKYYKKKEFNKAFKVVDQAIEESVNEILKLERGEKYINGNSKFIKYLNNYAHSFFRSYIYARGFNRGEEIFADVLRYNYFKNIMLYYRFWNEDVYNDRFHFQYLKVISRVFIEEVHKRDICGFVENNVNYYKEIGWL